MRLRDLWTSERDDAPRDGAGGAPGGEHLTRVREAGERFLAAGDEAIRRALSSNSEEFLLANRQQGGQ